MISCKFGTEIFKNMHTVTKTNFWSAQSGFKNRQIASKRRNVEYRCVFGSRIFKNVVARKKRFSAKRQSGLEGDGQIASKRRNVEYRSIVPL